MTTWPGTIRWTLKTPEGVTLCSGIRKTELVDASTGEYTLFSVDPPLPPFIQLCALLAGGETVSIKGRKTTTILEESEDERIDNDNTG